MVDNLNQGEPQRILKILIETRYADGCTRSRLVEFTSTASHGDLVAVGNARTYPDGKPIPRIEVIGCEETVPPHQLCYHDSGATRTPGNEVLLCAMRLGHTGQHFYSPFPYAERYKRHPQGHAA